MTGENSWIPLTDSLLYIRKRLLRKSPVRPSDFTEIPSTWSCANQTTEIHTSPEVPEEAPTTISNSAIKRQKVLSLPACRCVILDNS